ncbi:MAG: hypothetical protein M3Y91_03050 [Actinomycetota bacterium]|nr:hypothetical protein [Actinomycetota bacterium]
MASGDRPGPFLTGWLASLEAKAATGQRSPNKVDNARAVDRVRTYFAQALTVAERRGKLARNVARIAEMPATIRPVERRALTQAQAKMLLSAAEGHRLEALFVTGLMLGLRPGELTGLRWIDVDLERGQLDVLGR